MSTKSLASTAPICSIESFPNEILERVFSFIPMNEAVEYRAANGHKRLHSQVMTLMHTTRTFRLVALSSSFWIEYNFNFAALNPHWQRRHSDHDFTCQRRLDRICEYFFSIPELAQNLRRKKDWLISDPLRVLFDVSLPPSPWLVTARRVSLLLGSGWVPDFVLNGLAHCRGLTDLEIGGENPYLDLNILGSFSALKRLVLELSRTWHGTCDGLTGLEHFSVRPSSYDCTGLELSNDLRVLPDASNNSLVSLDVRGFCDETFTLEKFENLESLVYKLDPLPHADNSFYGALADNTSTIRSLETEIIILVGSPEAEECIAGQTALFSCPCLSALKELSLRIVFWGNMDDADPYIEKCMNVVQSISENLPTLEVVTLYAGLDVARTGCLSKLKRLKSLTWNFPRGGLRGVKRGGANAAEVVARVFKGVLEPPKVCVQLVRWNVTDATVRPNRMHLVEFPEYSLGESI